MNRNSVPQELKNLGQWIRWQLKDGRKVPIDHNGRNCNPYLPENWNSFESISYVEKIGVVLADPYLGIDLDNCIQSDGQYTDWAQDVLDRFKGLAYCEVSPSGTGLKLWTRARKPDHCPQDLLKLGEHEGIQVWDTGRWFAVTGQCIGDLYSNIGDGQSAFNELVEKYVTKKDKPQQQHVDQQDGSNNVEAAQRAIAKIPIQDGQDGSRRMVEYCRQAKRFCRDPQIALGVVKLALLQNPTPKPYDDERLSKELDGAKVQWGEGITSTVWDKTPKTPGKKGVLSKTSKDETEKVAIPDLLEYRPFPVEILPEPLGRYVTEVARSVPCDPSFVALPLLTGLAASIGNSLNLKIKRTWRVPSVLWAAVVAPSGSAKSVPPRQALRPIHARQAKLVKQWDKDNEEYKKKLAEYERELSQYKKGKGQILEPPDEPKEPVCPRIIVKDTTIEALGKRLNDNPRGILAAYDELAGWLGGFNRYSKGGSDEKQWLEFYNAQNCIIDRSSAKRPLMIDRASVSLFGTIQPGILRKHLTAEYKASGLAARILFAMPPRSLKQWTDYEVSEEVEDVVSQVIDRLLDLEMQIDENGDLFPALVALDDLSRELFINYYNRHNREQQQLDEDLYAAYSKLEEVAARLALIIHAVRFVTGDTKTLYTMDLDSMSAGIQLCEWFKHEAKRVYTVLAENELAHDNRLLIQWIANQDDGVTPRDFYRSQRARFDTQEDAEKLLQTFVEAGLGEWVPCPSSEVGGRPTRKFHLRSLGQNPNNPWDFEGSVQSLDETY